MTKSASSTLFVMLILISGNFVKANETLQDQYLRIYVSIHDADNLQKEKHYLGALLIYKTSLLDLTIMRYSPYWEVALLDKRIQACKEAIMQLTPLATKQLVDQPKLAGPAGPDKSTLFDEGLRLEKGKNYWSALDQFERFVTIVEIMRPIDSKWDTSLSMKRLDQANAEIDRLRKMEIHLQLDPR